MASHGVIIGGKTLSECYEAFYLLETIAASQIVMSSLHESFATLAVESENEMNRLIGQHQFISQGGESASNELKQELITMLKRGIRQKLFSPSSRFTSLSLRIPQSNEFIITPFGKDLEEISPCDILNSSAKENLPEDAFEHHLIYQNDPDVNAVFISIPLNAMLLTCLSKDSKGILFDRFIVTSLDNE